MYSSYEEYMQNVLGYNMPSNTYGGTENYYNSMRINQNMQEINSLYPEIYGIVYPVVQKVCSKRNMYSISKEQIDKMVDEVYNVVESNEQSESTRENLKNGDVRNPRIKEPVRAQSNYLLRDLIKILIIRELLSETKPNARANWNSPQMGEMQIPPIMRPRFILKNIN